MHPAANGGIRFADVLKIRSDLVARAFPIYLAKIAVQHTVVVHNFKSMHAATILGRGSIVIVNRSEKVQWRGADVYPTVFLDEQKGSEDIVYDLAYGLSDDMWCRHSEVVKILYCAPMDEYDEVCPKIRCRNTTGGGVGREGQDPD